MPLYDREFDGGAIMNLINLTSRAVEHILAELEKNKALGIRFSVRFGGCQGLTYVVDYVERIEEADIYFESNGVNVYVDPKAALFLDGMTVDFRTSAMSSGFFFENPNALKKCGCGLSFCSKNYSDDGETCGGQCCK